MSCHVFDYGDVMYTRTPDFIKLKPLKTVYHRYY